MAQQASGNRVKNKLRTINFFEVVKWKNNSVNERMKHVEWVKVLLELEKAPLKDRVWSGPLRTLIGEVLSVDGTPHLKLMQVQDEDAWLEIYNPDADSIDALNLGEKNQLLETSVIAFLPYGNVIGLIQGSISAPAASAFEDWINGMEILGKSFLIETQAMVSHDALKMVNQSSEASRIEVKVHTNKADALKKRGSGISAILEAVKTEYGPMTVTMILQPSKARDQTEGRAALRKEAKIIAQATDAEEVAKASANLIYIEADDTQHTEEIDFLKQRITAKRMVQTLGEDGSPIRNESAIRAILELAAEHEAELKAIVTPAS